MIKGQSPSGTDPFYMVPREGIGPPTPAFSGPRSTTELPRLTCKSESFAALLGCYLLKGEEESYLGEMVSSEILLELISVSSPALIQEESYLGNSIT